VIGGRKAGGEADVAGGARQRGDLHRRIERIDRHLAEDAAVALLRRQGVLEEHHIKLAARGDLGGFEIVVDADQPLGLGRGMAPRGGVAAAGQHPEAEMQLLARR